jgi:hypothetical protein
MFENYKQAPLSPLRFVQRVLRGTGIVIGFMGLSLLAGTLGYHGLENMSWIDAFYNAALIMSGMGPAGDLHTEAGKLFASLFSLYSGLFLVAAMGLLLMPFLHRMLHRLHYVEK